MQPPTVGSKGVGSYTSAEVMVKSAEALLSQAAELTQRLSNINEFNVLVNSVLVVVSPSSPVVATSSKQTVNKKPPTGVVAGRPASVLALMVPLLFVPLLPHKGSS